MMAMPAEDTQDLLDYALQYAELGFASIPVKGKFPDTKHGVKDASLDTKVLEFWFGEPTPGRGIALAVPEGFAVLDVDPRNGGDDQLHELVRQHGPLPDTAMALTGGGGEHYLFRVPVGKRLKKAAAGVDSLNPGKYFIVEPSMHSSGNRYEWEGSSNPLEGHPIADAPEWLLEDATPLQPAQVQALSGVGFLSPERVIDIRGALSYLDPDDYDNWIRIGQALHSTEAGQQAFGLWDEWSKGSEKYRPGETRKKWQSFRAGGGTNVESIFALAGQNGWVNPAGALSQARAKEDDELRALVAAREHIPEYERIEAEVAPVRQLPVQSLQYLATWIEDQQDTSYPQAVNAAVLSMASALAARNYVSQMGEPLHCYFGLITGSISQVRSLKPIINNFLAETGQRRLIRGTRISSLTSLYRTLERHPVAMYVADDYGQMLAFSRRQPSGVLDQALNGLADIYQGADVYVDPDMEGGGKNAEMRTIYRPAMGLLAMISEDQLSLLTKRSEIGRGSLQQMLMVETGEPVQNDSPRCREIEAAIKERVEAIQSLTPSTDGNLAGLTIACLPPTPRFVSMSPDAGRVIPELDRQLLAVAQEDRRLFPLAVGAKQVMRRIMNVLAVWENPSLPHVTRELADWAGQYVLDHLRAFSIRYAVTANDSGDLDVAQAALEQIIKAGPEGLSKRNLAKYCWPFRKLSSDKREEVIGTLLDDEEVEWIDTPSKRSKVLVSRTFLREVPK